MKFTNEKFPISNILSNESVQPTCDGSVEDNEESVGPDNLGDPFDNQRWCTHSVQHSQNHVYLKVVPNLRSETIRKQMEKYG